VKKTFQTEQETFWAGEFGDQYAVRNQSASLIAGNLALFSRIFSRCQSLSSLVEFGANIGMNLRAIRSLLPEVELAAVEINEQATTKLREWGECHAIFQQSILEFDSENRWDFALIKGVLIHIHPDKLPLIYATLAQASNRYVCIAEYYNPTPVAVEYRGHTDRMFKRDFAGEFLKANPQFHLVDYGFCYRGDPQFSQDDITWFLLEK